MTIKVRYSSIDHFRETRVFKTLKGARAYAVKWVGANPDFGSHYAISSDGIGKIEVSGCTLQTLFAGGQYQPGPYEVWIAWVNEDSGGGGWYKHRAFATLAEANACAQEAEEDGCDGAKVIGTTDEAKAEIEAQRVRLIAQFYRDDEVAKAHWTDICHANGEF